MSSDVWQGQVPITLFNKRMQARACTHTHTPFPRACWHHLEICWWLPDSSGGIMCREQLKSSRWQCCPLDLPRVGEALISTNRFNTLLNPASANSGAHYHPRGLMPQCGARKNKVICYILFSALAPVPSQSMFLQSRIWSRRGRAGFRSKNELWAPIEFPHWVPPTHLDQSPRNQPIFLCWNTASPTFVKSERTTLMMSSGLSSGPGVVGMHSLTPALAGMRSETLWFSDFSVTSLAIQNGSQNSWVLSKTRLPLWFPPLQ